MSLEEINNSSQYLPDWMLESLKISLTDMLFMTRSLALRR
jgi:hypothetical protein